MTEKNTISLTAFRANLYTLVDQLLATGEPLLIERHGRIVEISEKNLKSKAKQKYTDLSRIKTIPDLLTEDPEWYVSPALYEWKPDDFS